MAATVVIYIVAFKLGAFKNRKKEGFENDLKELDALNYPITAIFVTNPAYESPSSGS